ncbi:MAG: NIF family HAD-type phosphatase [Myxococcota bacterium]
MPRSPRLSCLVLSLLALGCSKATRDPGVTTPDQASPTNPEVVRPAPPRPSELAAMTLPPRPDWANKYAKPELDERFFDIAKLMDTHGLSRALAVELQNHYRDLMRAEPARDAEQAYEEALKRAKAGTFEDQRKLERLAEARFIVVFDLDETLYDQYFRDPRVAETCHDFVAEYPDGKTRPVALNPGWEQAIRKIDALGGAVVLFSANVDETCLTNARKWLLDGTPIDEHPLVAGFLTNSHLVLQPKHAGDPVVEPSKDLRIVDPNLTRSIIVDDNPKRLFQFGNVRVFKKFDAEKYCGETDPRAKVAYAEGLLRVVQEIEDSVRYMDAHPDTSFADAYRPYTVLGRVAVDWLRNGGARTEAEAIAELRARPTLADEDF